jgi:hypothetical protein
LKTVLSELMIFNNEYMPLPSSYKYKGDGNDKKGFIQTKIKDAMDLIAKGSDPKTTDSNKDNILHHIAKTQDVTIAKYFMEKTKLSLT